VLPNGNVPSSPKNAIAKNRLFNMPVQSASSIPNVSNNKSSIKMKEKQSFYEDERALPLPRSPSIYSNIQSVPL